MDAAIETTARQLSYAMRNSAAREHFLGINAPAQIIDWSHLAIEAMMILGAILALVHAWRHSQRSGTPAALYAFGGIFLYGLVMDVSSYYSVGNFWHGEFSVMLVWNRLPLYIAMLYPALIYHSVMTMRRYDFPPAGEAVAVAFYSGILYMIFDNLGPALNWWVWDRRHPASQPLLANVPLTSYHWIFLFNGALAFSLRKLVWDVLERGQMQRARLGMLDLPLLTIALGSLLFVPYNLFVFAFPGMLAVSALIHATAFFLAGFWFVVRYRRPQAPPDALLLFFPLLWIFGQLFICAAKNDALWASGPDGLNAMGMAAGNPWAIGAGMIVGLAMTLASHVRAPQAKSP